MTESKDELFNIWTYDKAGHVKITDRVVVDSIKEDCTLADIRASLIESKLDSKKARFPFCTKDGARIGDHAKWDLYKELITIASKPDASSAAVPGNKENAGAETDDESTTGRIKDEGKTEVVTPGDTLARRANDHDVYFELSQEETNRKYGELGANVKKFLDNPLDLKIAKDQVKLLTAGIKDFNLEGYDHSQWKSQATADTVSAGGLSDADWDKVSRGTHFLHGHRMVFSETEEGPRTFHRVDRAPYAAFTIKARNLAELGTAGPNVLLPERNPILFRYPLYTVTDDSYVNVFETANALSDSLASSNFSQRDVEASIGGGLFGYSVGVKGGFSQNNSKSTASTSQSKHRTMNITYNFPRVVLHLDDESLELTQHCKDTLKKIKDLRDDKDSKNWQQKRAVIQFHQKFGHFFATNIELGGKLFSKEQYTATDRSSTMEKSNAMKISAALSFSSPVVQASVSYSQETQKASSSSSQTSNMSRALSWEAVGGDTTLCNNPAAWSPTVKPFQNWRVINQKDVTSIADFIGKFKDYGHIPDLFKNISKESTTVLTCRFLLAADSGADGEIEEGQYYGLRVDKNERKNLDLYEALRGQLMDDKEIRYSYSMKDINYWTDFAEEKFKGEGYTAAWHEWVGIDPENSRTLPGGCIFQVDVESELDRPPVLQYNTPYKLYNNTYTAYLAADASSDARIAGHTLGLLYWTRFPERISKFAFLKTQDNRRRGAIEDRDNVELWLCDDDGKPIGQVKRHRTTRTTLAVELKTSQLPNILVASNAFMIYDRRGQGDF